MKRILILFLIISIISTTLTFTASALTEYTNIMGTPYENPAYTIDVVTLDDYYAGETIYVGLALNNITVDDGFALVHFMLYYDNTKVEPIIKNEGENEQMFNFLIECPDFTKWEGLNRLDEDHSRYDITFMTTSLSATAKENGSIVVIIPFLAKDTADGDIVFQVPHNSTSCVDNLMNSCHGNGGIAQLSKTVFVPLEPVINSGLAVNEEEGFLEGVAGGVTAGSLTNQFHDEVAIVNNNGEIAGENEIIGTGFIITNGHQAITVVILGDGNGDGQANSKDYLLAKRVFFGTYTLEGAELAALCIGGGSIPSASDYLKIKRHFLGTYNLYA